MPVDAVFPARPSHRDLTRQYPTADLRPLIHVSIHLMCLAFGDRDGVKTHSPSPTRCTVVRCKIIPSPQPPTGATLFDRCSHNGFSSLLPYLEQQALTNFYNYEGQWWESQSTVASTRIDIYICPSADDTNLTVSGLPSALGSTLGVSSDLTVFAPNHYALNKGVSDAWCIPFVREIVARILPSMVASLPVNVNIPGEEKGPFDINSLVRDRDILDGSSKTFLVGEAATGKPWRMCTDASTSPLYSSFPCGNPFNTPSKPAVLGTPAQANGQFTYYRWGWITTGVLPAASEGSVTAGAPFLLPSNLCCTVWPLNMNPVASSNVPFNVLDLTTAIMGVTDCRPVYLKDSTGASQQLGHDVARPIDTSRQGRVSGFHSVHPGGANFLMADSSVNFISENSDIKLLRGLSTIAGAESANLSDGG